jgi:cytochrome c peroxidase
MNTRTAVAALVSLSLLAACSDQPPVSPDTPNFAKADPPPTLAPDLAALGEAIFFDEDLSANGNQSCATCHDPEWGFTGPRSDINEAGAVYPGSFEDRFGNRKPPSAAYATQSPVLHWDGDLFVGGNFWDGRATGELLGNPAAEQAQGPFLNPVEQALETKEDVVDHVCANYLDLFPEYLSTLCDEGTTEQLYDVVGLAVAAFEDSPEVNAFSSKYDAYLAGTVKMTKEERKGLSLFRGKGKCSKCHVLGSGREKNRAVFTDFTFDNLGVPINPLNPAFLADGFVDPGLGGFLAGSGRAEWEALADDFMGMQKVPTLRNVNRRPDEGEVKAYGHNGYFKSLWEIVHFYNTRDVKPACPDPLTPSADAIADDCWPAPEVMENVNTAELGDLGLTFENEMAIVAFLRTLSDGFTP